MDRVSKLLHFGAAAAEYSIGHARRVPGSRKALGRHRLGVCKRAICQPDVGEMSIWNLPDSTGLPRRRQTSGKSVLVHFENRISAKTFGRLV
jgi:hypothetical protein